MGLEESGPLLAHPGPRLLNLYPGPVRRRDAAVQTRRVAIVVRRVILRAQQRLPIGCVVVARPSGRAQHVDVDLVAFAAVNRPDPFSHHHALGTHEVHQIAKCALHAGIDLGLRVVVEHCHPAAPRRRAAVAPGQRHPAHGRHGLERRCQDVHRQRQVECTARDRADRGDVEAVGAGLGLELVAGHRHHAPSRLVAPDAAVMRRVADRRTDVAAQLQRAEPRSHRCGRAARRATRRSGQIPGVARGAVDLVEALPVGQRGRHIALAEDHRAGAEQALYRHRVGGRDVVAKSLVAEGRRQPCDVERLLDRHRHAVQRTPAVALGQRCVGRAGAGAGALDIEHRQRVDSAAQTAPQARDPAQVEIEQLQGRDLLASDLPCQFVRRQKYLFSH